MEDVKVRFSVNSELGKFSFDDIDDLHSHPVAQMIKERVISWEQKFKEMSIGHLLHKEIGQEQAKRIHISFKQAKESQPTDG
ncbi:hypothetical protein [Bacillus alveayuensis]|uniref:hypothetical protein n=1 Tax=Aeribacillus alveayuensis TaxID=279215 RepID=UPI0005CDA97F|nr:hypothetical protein [Bacillus alveayuensis]